jgi:hypothetical protein
MRRRCFNKNGPDYGNYGGRGIGICERWNEFPAFFEDMGERPKGALLDRIDNEKGYSPENCRWASQLESSRNRRHLKRVNINGVTKYLWEWLEILEKKPQTVYCRIYRGWDAKRALLT